MISLVTLYDLLTGIMGEEGGVGGEGKKEGEDELDW